MNDVAQLNRRLGESLGLVCGGMYPRFAWKWAPDQAYFIYDRDNRTLLKKCWADAPAPDGGTLGKVWVLAEWRRNNSYDQGESAKVRIPVTREFDYAPYFETALAPGRTPTAEINQNYIWAIGDQLARSAEHDPDSIHNYMAEEKYTMDRNQARDSDAWQEASAAEYDEHVGAFSNTRPGTAGGFMSFGGL